MKNIRKWFSGYIDQPKPDQLKAEVKQFTKQIEIVDDFLRKISEQVDIMKICSTELHSVLKMGMEECFPNKQIFSYNVLKN